MAVGWMTVLKLVPWGDVIENAPKVAQGAKKLWNSVGKKTPVETTAPATTVMTDDPRANVQALQSQVAGLQVSVAELHQQMVDSSALIKSLADQNSVLVQRVALNHRRLLALALLVAALAVALAVQLFR